MWSSFGTLPRAGSTVGRAVSRQSCTGSWIAGLQQVIPQVKHRQSRQFNVAEIGFFLGTSTGGLRTFCSRRSSPPVISILSSRIEPTTPSNCGGVGHSRGEEYANSLPARQGRLAGAPGRSNERASDAGAGRRGNALVACSGGSGGFAFIPSVWSRANRSAPLPETRDRREPR